MIYRMEQSVDKTGSELLWVRLAPWVSRLKLVCGYSVIQTADKEARSDSGQVIILDN